MRFQSALSLLLPAAVLLLAPTAPAQTLEPGDSLDLLAAGGQCDSDTVIDPEDPAVTASADCDDATNSLICLAGIDMITDVAAASTATASLTYAFDVGADTDTEGNPVEVGISYHVSWAGNKEASSGTADVLVNLTVYDITDPMNPVHLAEVTVHGDSGTGPDSGTADATLEVELARGNRYAVVVGLEAGAGTPSVTMGETTLSDYFEDDGGLTIHGLTAEADFDIAALAEQVAMNTGAIADNAAAIAQNSDTIAVNADAIAANTTAIQALQQNVSDLMELLQQLREDFEGHTHTYLTGRGMGHNNQQATTTTPMTDDEQEQPGQPQPPGRRKSKSNK
jgi:hypothetical protein